MFRVRVITKRLLSCACIGRRFPASSRCFRPLFFLVLSLRLTPFLIFLTLLSWGFLLLSTLSHSGAVSSTGWPGWITLVAQGTLAASVFLHARSRPLVLHGQDFVGLLRRLVLGPGALALVCLALFGLGRVFAYWQPSQVAAVFAITHTLSLGLFIIFLAQVNYAWRTLVYFKSATSLRWRWQLLELLLGATLLLQLLPLPVPSVLTLPVLVLLGLFGIYLSGTQRWVAYLTYNQKWQVIGYQAAILVAMLLFLQYFRLTGTVATLLSPAPQHTFLLLTAFFAVFYSLMGLLVTFFNLPTAGVFEQRRAEIVSLQRLTQIIQRGQTAAEIYQTLLESAEQTVQADAAGLLLPGAVPNDNLGPGTYFQGLDLAQIPAVVAFVEAQASDEEFILNNLASQPGWPPGLPYGSLMVLPLRGLHRHYGKLFLLKTEVPGFDDDDIVILNTFTSQTVLSLENLQLVADSLSNQRTQEELRIAAQVQDSLIPKNLPTDDWFDIATHSLAAKEMGGDFYDFLLLPGRRLAVLIGDVSGKGVTAAFHMAQMKGIFHALMQENPLAKNEREQFPLPSRFMNQANTALAHCLEPSSFITSSLYIIDYEQGGFMFARAGHCPTLYYHAMREEVSYFVSAGLGLGILRRGGYERHINNQFYDYGPGDVMVLYTDGIVEARGTDDTEFGEDRLKALLERCYYLEAHEIKDIIMTDFNQFTAGCPVHDDQTMLVIKFKTAQPAPNS